MKKDNSMFKESKQKQIAVLGLGRFGMSIVRHLSDHNVSILACDKSSARLQMAAQWVTYVVQADFLDEDAMRTLGLGNFDVVIIASGEDLEACIMGTVIAKEQGATRVIVKAEGKRQEKILLAVGADQVVHPEFEMGARLARSIAGSNILEILEDSSDFLVAEMRPLTEWVGRTVRESEIREKHGLSILAIRKGNRIVIPVGPTDVIDEGDVLITLQDTRTN
jgi:trk system potassium uptake protein TrkA